MSEHLKNKSSVLDTFKPQAFPSSSPSISPMYPWCWTHTQPAHTHTDTRLSQLQAQFLLHGHSQLILLNLPGRSERIFIHIDHIVWDFEVRNLAPAKILDLLHTAGLTLLQLDTSTHLLSQPLILHSDHLRLLNFGMGVEELFYLSWVDVLPTSDDHVLDAALDTAVSKRIKAGYVPSIVPAICGDALPGLLWVIPVLQHHTVASDQQLSRDPQRNQLSGGGVHHFGLGVVHDTPNSICFQVLAVQWETQKCQRAVLCGPISYLIIMREK